MRRLLVVTACSALLGSAGCGGDDPTPAPSASTSQATTTGRTVQAGQRFVAAQLDGRDLVTGTKLSLEFDGARLIASAGCNTISGAFELKAGRLQFSSKPLMTNMACEPAATMEQEQWYADWLKAGVDVAIDRDTLVATGDGVTATYQRAESQGAGAGKAPISGTDWQLVATAERGADDVDLPSGVAAPTLRIDGERAALFTGCNRGSAKVDVRDDGFVVFDAVATTRKACGGDAGDIERQVLAVLRGKVAAAFDGDGRLVLTSDGARLTFDAQ